MKYILDLDKYEVNILKSVLKQEYYREDLRFNNKHTDSFDRDLISDSMLRLSKLITKLENNLCAER